MKHIWFGPADLAYLEAENDEEAQFIRSCPADWTWEEVREAFERGD